MVELIRILCPYPTIGADGTARDGLTLPQPRICQKCKGHDCWSHVNLRPTDELAHGVCPRGMSVVLCRFEEGQILCNGLIVKMLNSSCPRDVRKAYQAHKVGWEEIIAWRRSVTEALPLLEAAADRQAREAIHGLHDVKTAVSLVTRNAEAIIATLPGATDEEKIDSAPDELKALLKSVQLLHTRLSASSILANPEAASYGQKHPTPIHKVCFKMVRLFQELAARKRCHLRMTGTSYASPRCYDSFETIPLILIDNAVKYSQEGAEIVVVVQDMPDHVAMRVQSRGPLVPEAMRQAIFERGTRGPNSHRLVSKGSGLGLYIASVVAKAHGFTVTYEASPDRADANSGTNVFSCKIPLL